MFSEYKKGVLTYWRTPFYCCIN